MLREHPKIVGSLLISGIIQCNDLKFIKKLGFGQQLIQTTLGPTLAGWGLGYGSIQRIYDGIHHEFGFTLPNTTFRTKLGEI